VDDVKRVISEYESRKAKNEDKGQDKDGKAVDKDKAEPNKGKGAATSIPTAAPVSTADPTHRKFALHRQIFDMRRNEIKRKEMGVRAKEVGKGLPQVPRGF
jgi:hypothetical protein